MNYCCKVLISKRKSSISMNFFKNNTFQQLPFKDFLIDLEAINVKKVDSKGLTYQIVSARSNNRWWLLPVSNNNVISSSLNLIQPVTNIARLFKFLTRILVQFNFNPFFYEQKIILSGNPNFGSVFDSKIESIAYFTGTDGPHRKTAIQLMNSHGAIIGYAKLSRNSSIRPYIRNEGKMLHLLEQLEILDPRDYPKVLKLRDDKEMTILITNSPKNPNMNVPKSLNHFHLNFLDRLVSKTSKMGAGPLINELNIKISNLKSFIGLDWYNRVTISLKRLEPYSETMKVCFVHGDFTPWNSYVLDDRLYAFDWEYAHTAWPVGFDCAHFILATIPQDKQLKSLPNLLNLISKIHFDGDLVDARRAVLLSLLCHATFYINRLAETKSKINDWSDGPIRASMIDYFLNNYKIS